MHTEIQQLAAQFAQVTDMQRRAARIRVEDDLMDQFTDTEGNIRDALFATPCGSAADLAAKLGVVAAIMADRDSEFPEAPDWIASIAREAAALLPAGPGAAGANDNAARAESN